MNGTGRDLQAEIRQALIDASIQEAVPTATRHAAMKRRQAMAESEKAVKNQGLKRTLLPDGSVATNYVTYDEGYLTYTEGGNPPIKISGKVLALSFEPLVGGIKFSVDVGVVNRDGVIVQRTFSEQIAYRN